MNAILPFFLYAILAVLLCVAAVGDLRTREIPNWLNGAIALLAIPLWFALGMSVWPDMVLHVAVALAVLLLFAFFFYLGAMGGGDVKMLAALALWLSPYAVVLLLVIMSIAGGVLTLAMLVRQRMRKSPGELEIPYGVAIAFAGLWVIAEPFLNHFA
jgi:prepilin peptidase CpaA